MVRKMGTKRSMRSSFEKRNARFGYIFVLPLLIGLLMFIPNLIQTIIFSFNNLLVTENGYTLVFVGIEHFYNALRVNPKYIRLLVEFLQTLLTNVPVIVIFSLFISTVLNQKMKGKMFFRMVFFIPVLLSTGVVSLVESNTGILNLSGTLVETTTQETSIDSLMLSLNMSPFLMSIVAGAVNNIYMVVKSSGVQIFILLAGLQEIPDYLYEAAHIDGCSAWESFWKITFPCILPQLVVNLVYTIVDQYSKPNNALFTFLKTLAFSENQYGLATAMHLIYFVVIGTVLSLGCLIFSRRRFRVNG